MILADIDLEEIRQRLRGWFPALQGRTVFLENAGGSQVPACVAERVRDYMLDSYVQLGAGYELSRRATALMDEAHRFTELLVGAQHGRVALGPSTSVLLRMLGDAYARALPAGSEIVIAESGHEANIGPWLRLAGKGVELRWWRFDPARMCCPVEELSGLLSERTALVALPHVSNLLGGIEDLPRVVKLAHAVGARVVADGVAYAPHRAMDVEAWGVDWYAFSCYKVYGPHMAVLYGKEAAFAELIGPNHFFIPRDEIPYKFELGGVDHEACAGWLGVGEYLAAVAEDGRGAAGTAARAATGAARGLNAASVDRATVSRAGERMAALEAPLVARLLGWLREREDVQVAGSAAPGPDRVGTISFRHRRLSSRELVEVVDGSGVAIRYGHMYAWRLCEALGLDPNDGVVRISLLHYNTPDEIERLIVALAEAMDRGG
jgi:cysteine desulfurase family protein (TIGR01976 family)